MIDRANAAGAFAVWRAQVRRTAGCVVRDGRVEDTRQSRISGHAIQVVTDRGHGALASRDDFRPEPAGELCDSALRAAQGGERLGLWAETTPSLSVDRARVVPDGLDAFSELDLGSLGRRLVELEARLCAACPGIGVRLGFRTELDAWRIARTDGTAVTYAMPRCTLTARLSNLAGDDRHTLGIARHSPRPEAPWDDPFVDSWVREATRLGRLAIELADAPPHPSGNFPLVIDYALAKGLAHEAFGHASEADGFRNSVLARDGAFRHGDVVGPDHVSVVDEPVPDDHAWQPYSANGVRRGRATIVDHGRLSDALTDIWTARAGSDLTGAARAESFRGAPAPRMTNIRIEVDEPLPAPGRFEDYGPEEVRDLLLEAGVLRRHPRVVYLSGYGGGQVNTAMGEFVFNCRAIYVLSRDAIRLHKPAIFSGSMFGALSSIREAFGPLRLDALGTCGKWGQSVPSSGGSHWFLVVEPHADVRLGGR